MHGGDQKDDKLNDDADRNIPDVDRNIPDADRNIPDVDRNIPDADRNIPDADRNIPDADGNKTVPLCSFHNISEDHCHVNSENNDDNGHICGRSDHDPDIETCVKCCLDMFPGTDSGSELDVEDFKDLSRSLSRMRYRKEFGLDDDDSDSDEEILEREDAKEVFSWSEDRSVFTGKEETFNETSGPTVDYKSPYDLFCQIWDRTTVGKIVSAINEYAEELSKRGEFPWVKTDIDEMYVYLGLFIAKSFYFMHRLEDYWEGGKWGIPIFGKTMTVDRFLSITKSLHFVDNKTIQANVRGADLKLAKIQPIIDCCRERFSSMYRPGKFLCITNTMLNWKDVDNLYECKPRFHMRGYELCEAESGYVLNFTIYNKKDSNLKNPKHGFVDSSKVILELVTDVLGKGHCLILGTFFYGLSLIRHLKTHKTDATGSIQYLSKKFPPVIETYKKDKSRKDLMCHYTNDICIVFWKIRKHVANVFTTYRANGSVSNCTNDDLRNAITATHEQYNFGEDLRTSLGDFRMERLTLKWCTKIFLRMLNISVFNVWILYKANCGTQTTQGRFRRLLLTEIIKRHKESCDFLNSSNDSNDSNDSPEDISMEGSSYDSLDSDMLVHDVSYSSDSED